MDALEKDEVPMLSATYSQMDDLEDPQSQRYRTRSASISIPVHSIESHSDETNPVGFTGPLRNERKTPLIQMSGPLYVNREKGNSSQAMAGGIGVKRTEPEEQKHNGRNQDYWPHNNDEGRNEHLLRSGQLGMCNDPYCTTCPTYYNFKGQKNSRPSVLSNPKLHNVFYGDAKGWARKKFCVLKPYILGVINPHAKVIQKWNKFFVVSCLVAIFIDPLFFFLLSVQQDEKCIVINWTMTTIIVVFRSMTDFIYLVHMLLQFRLAFVAPESMVVGAGDLVDNPKTIALNYLKGYFLLDFFVVLPLPQFIILFILSKAIASSGANYAKNLLRAAVLAQYIPRLYRFWPFLAGQSPSGFIFESAWANFVMNLLTFVLSGHVVGSCWYLFGLQRVNQCLRDACHNSAMDKCTRFIDCGHGLEYVNFESDPTWEAWKDNTNASACFSADGFHYGIYVQAVNLTTKPSVITRYVYSFFWGFQQISTLAGNQTPSYFVWEVLFTIAIIGLGLLLFALLIGNMQNFLQGLGRRRLEMSLRRRDVELWMSHRRLPEELRRKVQESERYNWAATRGVNEEMLMENLPEDLQKDIRRHLFTFVKKVRIFSLMDEPILDAICERLRQKTYIKGSRTLCQGGLVTMMIFIVRGKLESIGKDGNIVPLSEGDVCGEELLTWCLEHSSVNKDIGKLRIPGHRLLSNRTVKCLTNVEAFVLRAADLEEVTSLFSRFLRNPRVQAAIRNESLYWRTVAANCIQVAWRYRKKRQSREDTSGSHYIHPSKY